MNIVAYFFIGGYGLKKINDMMKKNKKNNNIDNFIEEKIKNEYKKKKNNNQKFKLGKFESTRKIPNKQELNKVYDNFIKNIDNIEIEKEIIKEYYNFKYNKKQLVLKEDDRYMKFNINLNKSKNYILSLTFHIHIQSNIKFLFKFKNDKYKSYNLNQEKESSTIIFTTYFIQNKTELLYDSEFYILFDNNKTHFNLSNIEFKIIEYDKKYIIPMTIIKSNKTHIY